MAARFAGSRSLDERRRRRLAAEEKQPSAGQDKADLSIDRQLPTRRPTGRFPLRRLIPSSRWKLTAATVAVFAGAQAAALAGTLLPGVRSGEWGPGFRSLLDADQGRLATSLAGLLLLASAQLAWLIRWARARSLRDFGGGYRVWLWASAALFAAGACILTDAHLAFASTVAWATGRQLFGSDAAYQVLPALGVLVLLVPSLQSDMRACITSRTLMLTAVSLLFLGAAGVVAGRFLQSAFAAWNVNLPTNVVIQTTLMTGTTSLFASLMFHARHVVYESVEPPERKPRRPKALPRIADESSPVEEESKPSARKTGRASRASKAVAAPEPAAVLPVKPAAEKSAAKDPPAVPEVAVRATAKTESATTKPSPPTKPAAVAPPVARQDFDEADEDGNSESHADFNGQQYRLDGPEELHGLSKRERRKMRKAMKDRDRMET